MNMERRQIYDVKVLGRRKREERQEELSWKEMVKCTSQQLAMLPTVKLDKIKYPQHNRHKQIFKAVGLKPIPTCRDISIRDVQKENESQKENDMHLYMNPLSFKLPRQTLRALQTSSTKNLSVQKDRHQKMPKSKMKTSHNKYAPFKPYVQIDLVKCKNFTEWTMPSLKKRGRNLNSYRMIQTTKANQQQTKHYQYYITDIKTSLAQLKHNQESINDYLTHFMQSLSAFKMFPYSYLPANPHKLVTLPPIQTNKITLVFDLDETLIHAQIIQGGNQNYSEQRKIVDIITDQRKYQVSLKIRPHAIEVLQRLSQKFQLGIFTAGQQHYASRLIKQLDPDLTLFSFRLYRPHCLQLPSRVSYMKDLRVLANRELSKTVLIDNNPHSYIFQKRNGIPIVSYYGDRQDTELLKLQTFLMKLQGATDVQTILHEHFRLDNYSDYNSMVKLVDELY